MKQRDVLERVLSSIRYHTSRRVPVGQASGSKVVHQLAIEQLLVRAQAAVLVGASASARRDGFPSTTPGNGNPGSGKGGRPLISIEGDLVPTSSTERAVIDPPVHGDPVSRAAGEINQLLHTIERALEHLDQALVRFDRLRSTATVADPPMCAVATMRKLTWDPMWEPWRTTDFAGQLDAAFDAPRPVCRFVYWFVRNHHRLPERAEMVEYLERETVKVHA